MKLYCGIDLHTNNVFMAVLDESDRMVLRCRLSNDLSVILATLEPHRAGLAGIVVESTFNGYWLVDGLMAAGHRVHLANPGAMQPYSGLKHVDDGSDARWLAHMLRIGLLPEGYIYPREQRGLRFATASDVVGAAADTRTHRPAARGAPAHERAGNHLHGTIVRPGKSSPNALAMCGM